MLAGEQRVVAEPREAALRVEAVPVERHPQGRVELLVLRGAAEAEGRDVVAAVGDLQRGVLEPLHGAGAPGGADLAELLLRVGQDRQAEGGLERECSRGCRLTSPDASWMLTRPPPWPTSACREGVVAPDRDVLEDLLPQVPNPRARSRPAGDAEFRRFWSKLTHSNVYPALRWSRRHLGLQPRPTVVEARRPSGRRARRRVLDRVVVGGMRRPRCGR